jgi:hypothetical protein
MAAVHRSAYASSSIALTFMLARCQPLLRDGDRGPRSGRRGPLPRIC